MDLRSLGRALLFPLHMLFVIVRAAACRLLLPRRRAALRGDLVLVTGGGRGIGRHLALEFAKQGAKKVTTTHASSRYNNAHKMT